jgi:extradiol dioxygenase family protein
MDADSETIGMEVKAIFHLAFPVRDLAQARAFYGDLLGCPEGRSSSHWIDFDFYGHQIVAHLAPDECGHRNVSEVDGEQVPYLRWPIGATWPEGSSRPERDS